MYKIKHFIEDGPVNRWLETTISGHGVEKDNLIALAKQQEENLEFEVLLFEIYALMPNSCWLLIHEG